MKFNIKNKQIKEAAVYAQKQRLFAQNQSAYSKLVKKSTIKQTLMNILYEYAVSLAEVGDYPEVKARLDLTYDTIQNLMKAIAYEFVVGKNSFYTDVQNIEIAEKTIAAYLTLLAMNEHNCEMYVEKISNLTPELMNDPSTWSGFRVSIQGKLIKSDLLNATTGTVTFEEGVLNISMDKVMSVYESLAGVNLKEKGIDSIQAKMQ